MKIFSLFDEVFHQSLAKFNTMIERVLGRKPTTIEKIFFFRKMIADYVVFGASITDFFEMEFYKKTYKEKKPYHTYRFAKKFDYALDSAEKMLYFNSKITEYKELKKYFKREQLVSETCSFEEFKDFISRHPVFFLKPDKAWSGSGIERIDTSACDIHDVYNRISSESGVIDEPVSQHPVMEQLCPGCVNTIRVITAKVKNNVFIMGTAIRIGSGTDVVDNYFYGGFGAAIDKNTGAIIDDAMNYTNKHFREHPVSHIVFKGFQIPLWDEVLNLVDDAAHEYDLNYCGWDIAIREDDCVLVEANVRPMIQLIQIAGNGGKKEIYKKVYKYWKKNH